jgi:putative nucleotidyltransferase with HDIG domain
MRYDGWSLERKGSFLVAGSMGLFLLHYLTPAGPHFQHWLHLAFQKGYYLLILLAASWLGFRGTMAVTALATALTTLHIVLNWAGQPMAQADMAGEILSYWIFAVVAALLFERMRRALEETRISHIETLSALASSLDLRERGTGAHSRRVQAYALLLARHLGIRDGVQLETLRMGALLHDIGKIGIPDEVLLKARGLDDAETGVIRRHPELGAKLIGEIGFLEATRELVRSHHEKFDGTGYPRGIRGAAIPLGARIFAVADVYDALTTTRPYRDPYSWTEAREILRRGRGSHFDPDVVDAFLGIPYENLETIAREKDRLEGRGGS